MEKNILNLLSLTMISANLLVEGGIVYDQNNIDESNKRKARKALQKLYERKWANFRSYHCSDSNKPQKFYAITKQGLEYLGKSDAEYHQIKIGTLEHDKLTALYLTHLYRYCERWNIDVEWYPPFPLNGKVCDGAVILLRNEKFLRSIVIETDRATHAHKVMREKFEAYISYLPQNPNLYVLFIVSSLERSLNLQSTLKSFLEDNGLEEYRNRISFICPKDITPDEAIFELPVSWK